MTPTRNVFEEQYVARGASAQRSYPNESLIQFVARRWFRLPVAERKKVKILEVGCGSGANLWMLAKEGFDTYGIDNSPTGLAVAKQILDQKWQVDAQVEQADFSRLPYGDETFDAVVDVVSLQHVTLADSPAALREIYRVLKPGGAFFSYRLSEGSSIFSMARDQKLDKATLENISDKNLPLNNNGQISFWSETLVRDMHAECGLKVTSIDLVKRTYGDSGIAVEYLAIDAEKQ